MAHSHRIGRCHIELLSVSRECIICATDLRILISVDILTCSRADSNPIDQAARVDNAVGDWAATLHQTAPKSARCQRSRVALVLGCAHRV